ncbi:MAG TPA: hypothetical protein VGV67_01680 [Solirubrobacteraceae bacterium]|nr:hypothetical protein [Solirubrobacteraceae bacterium]
MQRFGEEAVRVFKFLAGHDRDEPIGAHVYAVYSVLFMVALILCAAWITGAPR